MGTRSKTTIFDEHGQPLVSIYRQMDGHFESHGEELAAILKDIAIVNGYGSDTPKKAANGMGCLAAQVIAALKTEQGIGGIYICRDTDKQEYNYEIRFVKTHEGANYTLIGRVSLVGTNSSKETYVYDLYGNLDTATETISFVYDKGDGSVPKWRDVGLTKDSGDYIEGYENGTFKRFLKTRIIDGRILKTNK